jgi:aminoglycoside/choline kinase family phosphotransferase
MRVDQTEFLLIQELYNKSRKKIKDDQLGDWINISKLTGDASTRKYYRIHTSENSFVVCLDSPLRPEQENYTFLVVQKYFEQHQIRVPKIYDKDTSKGYILEEDLGDITLLRHLSTIDGFETELNLYKKSIDQIVKLHSISSIDSKTFNLSFDYNKLKEEIDFSLKFFINIFLNKKNIPAKISAGFDEICLSIAKEKMVITHRDFHSRNIMIKDEKLILIDFQDARMGAPQYDLASLLEDCYYRVNGENKDKLRRYYWDQMDKDVVGSESFEDFNRVYVDVAIQRVFKAIGSFSYIYHTRNDYRYLKYIGFAMENLRLLLLQSKKYDELRKKLFELYYAS